MRELFKNKEILEEDYKTADLLGFDDAISDFRNKLDCIKKNSVVGLVGPFGSGKSTMLYQLYKGIEEDNNEIWFEFDAWKYPERNDLWEGFVLDFARKIGEKTFQKAKKYIDGQQNDDKKALVSTMGDILSGIMLPGFASLGAIKNLNHFFETSPARRVFEIQEILNNVIENIDKKIYVIVEDIDRSGDRGIYFLETLRNFVKNNSYDKKIIVIVPIGDDAFSSSKDSYLKTIDYRFDFNISKIKFDKFIEKIFDNEDIKNFNEQIKYLFKLLAQKQVAIREIKHILRIADLEFSKLSDGDKKNIDKRIFILFQVNKYLHERISITINNNQEKLNGSLFGRRLLYMIANNINNDKDLETQQSNTNLPIFFVESVVSDKVFIPGYYLNEDGREYCYYLSNKYLNIFK